jgi:plasmid replication initiation protein
MRKKDINVVLEAGKKFRLQEKTMQQLERAEEAIVQKATRKTESANIKAIKPVCLTRYRNARFIMANPLFSCDRKKRTEPIRYRFFDSEGYERFVEVTADATYGMATQRDADIIRYAISKIGEIGQQTGYYPDTIEESSYALLKAIGKDDSKRDYDWLKEALERLSRHTIKTNAFTPDSKNIFLDNIAGFEWVENKDRQIKNLRIRVAKFLIEAIRNKGILVIDQAVIEESGSLTKRILELVQVHMGTKNEWEIGLEKLKSIIPYTGKNYHFKEQITRRNLPYKITFRNNSSKQQIVRFQR